MYDGNRIQGIDKHVHSQPLVCGCMEPRSGQRPAWMCHYRNSSRPLSALRRGCHRLGRSLSTPFRAAIRWFPNSRMSPGSEKRVDTYNSYGKAFFRIMGVLAELERDMIRERTKAGLEAAKKRGSKLGRPRKLSSARIEHAQALLEGGKTRKEVAHLLNVSPVTLWRATQNVSNTR